MLEICTEGRLRRSVDIVFVNVHLFCVCYRNGFKHCELLARCMKCYRTVTVATPLCLQYTLACITSLVCVQRLGVPRHATTIVANISFILTPVVDSHAHKDTGL